MSQSPGRWRTRRRACGVGRRRSPGRRCWSRCGRPTGAAAPACPRCACARAGAASGATDWHNVSCSCSSLTSTSSYFVLLLLLAASLARLTGLHAHLLALIADALALVGLRLADRANVRGHLADELFVDAADRHLVCALDGERDALRRQHLHWVRVAN